MHISLGIFYNKFLQSTVESQVTGISPNGAPIFL